MLHRAYPQENLGFLDFGVYFYRDSACRMDAYFRRWVHIGVPVFYEHDSSASFEFLGNTCC